MSFWDDLGNTAIGGMSGYLTGGGLGGALGAISGALNKKPLTLGTSLDTALKGAGAGALSKGALGALGRMRFPASNKGYQYGANPPPESGIPGAPPFEGPLPPSSGWGDRALDSLGLGSGQFHLGIGTPGITPGTGSGQGFGDSALGALGQAGKRILGQGRGLLDQARGVFGGGAQQGRVGTPENPEIMGQGWGRPAGQGGQGGTPRGGLQDLAILGGLGLGAYGLANPPGTANLDEVFAGSEGQTQGMIDAQVARQNALRQQAEEQFGASRAAGRSQLESVLGQGTDEALRQAIQGRQEQLNRQGLLEGPSGALNYALAQEAGKVRQSQLPYLLDFDTQTNNQLNAMRAGGLDSQLGLENAGLERQFGLGDARRSTSLRQKLLDLENKRAQQRAIMGASGTALGYGFGGLSGAQAGGDMGRKLEDVLR